MRIIRRLIAAFGAVAVATSFVAVSSPSAQVIGPPVTVKLTVLKITDIDDDADSTSDADFYVAGSFFDGVNKQDFNNESKRQEGREEITPNWEFFFTADSSAGGTDVNLRALDYDSGLNGGDDPVFDLTVRAAYRPCRITGQGVNVGCGWDIKVPQTDEVTFKIEVFLPPSSPGLRIRCLQKPLLPLPGESVTITAQTLDGSLLPTAKIVDEIDIDVNNTNVKHVTGTSTTTYTFTPSDSQFTYRCSTRNAADPDGADTWTRQVRVGRLPELASPIGSMGSHAANVDILAIADADTYASWDDATFLADLYNQIWDGYYGNTYVLTHHNQLSLWISQAQGDTDGTATTCDRLQPPENWDRYSFADTGWIVHNDMHRDCARRSQRIFGAGTNDPTISVHETGHSPFGLADEYCCDGGYRQAPENPNVYAGQAACATDAPTVGRTAANCRNITADWWTSDPMNDVMAADQRTFNALDIRRWETLLANCTTTPEGC